MYMAHKVNSKAPLPRETHQDTEHSHSHFLSTPTIFFFPGNCLPWAIIRNDFHVHFTVSCLFCLLKKSRLWLSLSLFPATQLRLSALPLLFESLLSISTRASDFFFGGGRSHSFSLLVTNHNLAKETRVQKQRTLYLNNHL